MKQHPPEADPASPPARVASCAIDFYPSAFSSSSPQLMGMQAANEGWLDGFIRHAGQQTLLAHTRTAQEFETFAALARKLRGEHAHVQRVRPDDRAALARIGALLHPFPGFGPLAWTRRFGSPQAYSLLGITHTIATQAVMDSIGNLLVAPIEEWDAVICTSQAVRRTYEAVLAHWQDYLRNRLGATRTPRPQLPVIPLGVDTARFAEGDAAQALRLRLRQQLEIAEQDLVVLWVGRFNHLAKAHPVPAYLALQALAEQLPARVHFVQAGWFAQAGTREAFADAARRFAPRVRHVFLDGREPRVRQEVWSCADIFLSLSDNLQESFGLTPIEAMAAGLPVVVSDWDGYRDTVREGVDGFRVPTRMPGPGHSDDWAGAYAAGTLDYASYCGLTSQAIAVDLPQCVQALRQLASDPALRARMGESGRAHARATYDWRHVVAQVQGLCEELGARRARAASTAPRSQGHPPHPLRADPFDVFAHFATGAVSAHARLRPGPVPASQLELLARHELNRFAGGSRLPVATLAALLAEVTRQPGLTMQAQRDIHCAGDEAAWARSVTWLLKMGLLSIDNSPP